MKKLNKKNCLVAVLLFGLGFMLTVLPAQLPAQDIDDVIDGLDQDFSLGGKQEVKQSNVAAANEQNREDIQIRESTPAAQEAGATTVTADLTVSFTGIVASNFQWDSVNVDGTSIPVGSPLSVPVGTITQTVSGIVFPAGLSFTLGINLTCNTSPNCDATLNISGALNCGALATGSMVLGESKLISTTCTT